ncbi:MAG TPA: sigma-70 family RNA polymerase sigma factor, partial [Gemmataceae bacterium]|nr:sigma-70 family RNA polymerase sigma factor [Gemmataceae bacterium]
MQSSTTLAALVAHCRKLTRRQHTPDAELLRRFAASRDNTAFEELLERYAPLVWGVCRRIVSNEADCEDAFQAVFVALFRQAGAVDPQRPLGAWLHGVAVHAALKAAARSARQPPLATVPERATIGDIADELGNRELFRLIDEEIARLPVKLREPFVLCCLEGRTRDEAAAMLGCSVTTIKGRLERSRTLLRRRLERRGIGLPAAFLVLGLTGGHVSASLRVKAFQCVLGSAPAAIAALVPVAGVSLASKLTLTAISFVMVGMLGFGALQVIQTEPPKEAPAQAKDSAPKSPQPPAAEKPQPRLDRFGDPLPPGAVRRFGTLRFRHDSILDLAFTPDG